MNWLGAWTLYKKEVLRFMKVYNQTILSPMVSAITFLMIFVFSMGGHVTEVNNIPFKEFMAAGLIIMSVVQNAFANTSSVIIMGKVIGNIIDYLIPPISPFEFTIAVALGGITRGVIVGVFVTISLMFFAPIKIFSLGYMIAFLFLASLLLSLLGILCALISDNFDQMSAITNFLITPLSFLSGTFYSTSHLPEFFQKVNYYNPFFYMIDGFRYGMTGVHDGNLHFGLIYLLLINIIITALTYKVIKSGWRIKN